MNRLGYPIITQSSFAATTIRHGKQNSSLHSYSPLGESAELIGQFPGKSPGGLRPRMAELSSALSKSQFLPRKSQRIFIVTTLQALEFIL